MTASGLAKTLTPIIAAITQTSDRRASVIVAGVGGKLGSAFAAAGLVGFIQAFGAVSTGAAISGLSGAALSSATLYWIGSIFGLGAVAGGMILTGGGIVFAFVVAVIIRRILVGRPRNVEFLGQGEKEIVYACAHLLGALPASNSERQMDKLEMALVCQVALVPIIEKIEEGLSQQSPSGANFNSSLAFLPRRKLRRQLWKLKKIVKKHPMPQKRARGWRRLFSRSRSSA